MTFSTSCLKILRSYRRVRYFLMTLPCRIYFHEYGPWTQYESRKMEVGRITVIDTRKHKRCHRCGKVVDRYIRAGPIGPMRQAPFDPKVKYGRAITVPRKFSERGLDSILAVLDLDAVRSLPAGARYEYRVIEADPILVRLAWHYSHEFQNLVEWREERPTDLCSLRFLSDEDGELVIGRATVPGDRRHPVHPEEFPEYRRETRR